MTARGRWPPPLADGRAGCILGLLALALAFDGPALADWEPSGRRSQIWDVRLGDSVAALQAKDFVRIACGTNGGPSSMLLAGFAEFAKCPADAMGLRELSFEYDDEALYWAKAHHYLELVDSYGGTRVFGFDVVVSLLLDDGGVVQGMRIVTDTRAPVAQRERAYSMGDYALANFAASDWRCVDHPERDRYRAAGLYIDKTCERTDPPAGRRLLVAMTHFRKPGQTALNPFTGRIEPGNLESSARLEIFAVGARPDAAGAAPDPPAIRPAEAGRDAPGGDARDRFLAGLAPNCPGCDLTGANLKGRDLRGADFAGAILVDASLHRANLDQARFADADLSGANLNRAMLRRADFRGAVLVQTMFHEADLGAADFRGAKMRGAMMGGARLMLANMAGVELNEADLREAHMVGVTLEGATARNTTFDGVNMNGAKLRGAKMNPVSLWAASLRDVDARGVDFTRSDFLQADLGNANLEGAVLKETRLYQAKMTSANTTGVDFSGAILPDGTLAPGN